MEEKLRQFFKSFNHFMLFMWRLGLGQFINASPSVGGRIMVLTHTGRKSGLRRQTPVNYVIVNNEIYCTAGFGQISDWYRNIKANPHVEVWLPDGWWEGVAEEVTEPEKRLPLLRAVLIASGFAAPLAGVNPRKMDDDQLAAVTESYCLIQIRRSSPRTGRGGPGELAWIWPAATFLLLPLLLICCRPRRCCKCSKNGCHCSCQ
jgi:deazaflavin-dependent oxidoreductase (nitroreductase family)